MLYDYTIIYDYKTEIKKYNSLSLAGFTLIKDIFEPYLQQKVHSCSLRYILVLKGTNVHLFEYKLQRCPHKGTIVYILHIVFSVCCM